MGVCRRIFKNYEPTELTICVTIYSEPQSPPKFNTWTITKPGCPPRIIPCSKGYISFDHFVEIIHFSGSTVDENRERKARKKVVKRRKRSDVSEKSEKITNAEYQMISDQPLLHSDSATLISEDFGGIISSPVEQNLEKVEGFEELKKLESRDRHVSITSLESVAGLGGMMSHGEDSDDVQVLKKTNEGDYSDDEKTITEEVIRAEEEEMRQKENKKKKFDLLSNGDVEIPTMQSIMNENGTPKKKVLVRKKNKSKTPESAPRYREFTETSINMYIEMNKQNIGEFVWDQQCTRIDALVAPILELDRTTTPEIPVEIEIFD
ncbi:hypothetical protein CAEBREN_02593 [Caenorhabditis brenneri]|uniref:Uncharacterized protein n=1 Tax=Caenorhabditis brenneri TaxID=135651 RepID=G0NUS2_CAEBE|nr:hypothetical protein CAEBREN_02593 [Caenorhabditis brenneri]